MITSNSFYCALLSEQKIFHHSFNSKPSNLSVTVFYISGKPCEQVIQPQVCDRMSQPPCIPSITYHTWICLQS